MAPSVLQWFTGYQPRAPTREVIERAIDELCTPPAATKDEPNPLIPDNHFVRIASLLRDFRNETGYYNGSFERPRIFAVLRKIKRLDVMPVFVEEGVHDYSIPFNPEDLPDALGHSKDDFLNFQKYVCTEAKEIERGIHGSHVHLSSSGDEYFMPQLLLGNGAQGSVHKVLSRLGYQTYARKTFSRRGNTIELRSRHQGYIREIKALKRLCHRHLVRVVGSYSDKDYFAILMSPVAQYNLQYFLENARLEYLPTLRTFFGCLASTVAYLHDNKVHHMDLKLSNILIKEGMIYVADFGSVHDFLANDKSTTQTPLPYTARYAPPELFTRPSAPRNWATDMWSVGVVYLEMFSVLRGKRITEFREFLSKNGDPFVSGNLQATYKWLDMLSSLDNGPVSDNEPIMWIRRLIQHVPNSRDKAMDLFQQILKSPSAEQWRQSCCAQIIDNQALKEIQTETNMADPQDAGAYAEAILPQLTIGAFEKPQSTSKDASILSWIDGNDGHEEPPDGAGEYSRISPHSQRYGDLLSFDYDRPDKLSNDISDWSTEPLYELSEDDITSVLPVPTSAIHIQRRLEEFDFLDRPPPDPRLEKGELGDYDGEDAEEDLFDIDGDSSSSDNSDRTVRPLSDFDDASNKATEPSAQTTVISEPDESGNGEKPPNLREQLHNSTEIHTQPTTRQFDNPELIASDFSDKTTSGSFVRSRPFQHDLTSGLVSNGLHDHSLDNHTSSVDRGNVESPRRSELTQQNLSDLLRAQHSESKPPKDAFPANAPASAVWDKAPDAPTVVTTSTQRTKRPPAVSAGRYIAQVYRAESEAATSVMSERTARAVSGSIGFTRWMDRDHKYLEYYTKQGDAGAVRTLLEKKCNPGTLTKPRPRPILNAVAGASGRHNKCARALLQYGANPDVRRKGKPALHMAVQHGYFKGYGNLICELLMNGADPDIRDSTGDTALHKILLGGYGPLPKYRRDALALLIHFNADINAVPPGSLESPLHLAVRREDPWAVSMLLYRGARVDKRNSAGMSLLGLACSGWVWRIDDNQREVLLHLLYAGADVNGEIGSSRSRPLHFAILRQDEEVVRILLQDFNADPKAVDLEGKDSLQVLERAYANGNIAASFYTSIKSLLREYKA